MGQRSCAHLTQNLAGMHPACRLGNAQSQGTASRSLGRPSSGGGSRRRREASKFFLPRTARCPRCVPVRPGTLTTPSSCEPNSASIRGTASSSRRRAARRPPSGSRRCRGFRVRWRCGGSARMALYRRPSGTRRSRGLNKPDTRAWTAWRISSAALMCCTDGENSTPLVSDCRRSSVGRLKNALNRCIQQAVECTIGLLGRQPLNQRP
jgi:hypothetical protein